MAMPSLDATEVGTDAWAGRALRIGVLGAARIAPTALIRPAREVANVEVTAVAARSPKRAASFAARHGIARVHPSYTALLDDPEIDAVYNPLPNSLHCEWSLRALAAGKHVLCEKPFASNRVEAQRMAEAGEKSGLVLAEAFHWRHHPLAARMREIVRSGELGEVRHIETRMCVPLLLPGDIRYRLELAGGAMMDVGSYCVNMLRYLAEAEPSVERAEVRLASPGVDRWATADLRFEDGRTGRLTASLASIDLLSISARVDGTRGSMRVRNPVLPHLHHLLRVGSKGVWRRERVPGAPTYTGQLRAFVQAVRGDGPIETDAWDAVRNMAVIDEVYRAAGLAPRGPGHATRLERLT